MDRPWTVRRIRAGEGARLQRVRLAALADSPAAFGSTLEREQGYPPSLWDERAAGSATGSEGGTWIAEYDSESDPIGVVAAFRPRPDHDAVQLVSMWVAPSARRSGVGEQLVRALVEWAATTEFVAVELMVADGNDGARRLYERLGFRATGLSEPLESDPSLMSTQLRLGLLGDEPVG